MKNRVVLGLLVLICFIYGLVNQAGAEQTAVDAMDRPLNLPERDVRILCSGPGCLRLVSYLGVQDLVAGVDDMETRKRLFDARPYALANPQYRDLPVFGSFRGQDDPEKILGLDPLPQVIFKTYPANGYNPEELQKKTGIPVVVIDYGDLGKGRSRLFASLSLMGRILNRGDRAREVIEFFKGEIAELEKRTGKIHEKKTCFIGGIAFKGPHGFNSTEPSYPPFEFVGGINIAGVGAGKTLRHTLFSKEKILVEDPEYIFVDLSTLQMGDKHGGLFELKTDPVYRSLTAVQAGRVFGVLPYNWYTQNFGSILADAWYIGKILYPEKFKGISPAQEADRIYCFLLSQPVFGKMNRQFQDKVFTRLKVED